MIVHHDIRVAMIGLGELGGPGVGARGHQLIDRLRKVPGVRIVALCDVDKKILGREMERFSGWNERVESCTDMRAIFDASDVDAVFVATPNHWHAFDDDGQTPNTQIALLDYESAPIICEVRGLPEKLGAKKMDRFRSLAMGIIVQCQGGYYMNGSGTVAVFDGNGQKIKEFTDRRAPEEQGSAHQANFIEAMRSRNADDLNAEILDGYRSTALCHMANVSYRLGKEANVNAMADATAGNPQLSDAFERFERHLAANEIDPAKTPATLGPWVTLDSSSEEFVGDFAEQANALSRRKFREPFVVPEIV